MPQHDYDLANQSGAAFRGDLNNALAAVVSDNSGAAAPATTFAYESWADTTNLLVKRRNAANSAWIVRDTLAETLVLARSSNTIIGAGDYGRTFNCTSSFTQTLTAAATLGDGFWCAFVNSGTGLITIDPNGAETIDGLATLVLNPGEAAILNCNGTLFITLCRRRLVDNAIADGRLTLTTALPVTTSDVTAATTVYFTPYKGNSIALYNGTFWELRSFAEISVAVPAIISTPFDIFVYDNAGTAALEALAWTNDTTRATALVLQDGVLVKSGATTRRYLGTARTTTVSGQTEDSVTKRYLWNYYNRVARPMVRRETTASWTYTTATLRQANGNTANQLDFVIGVSEDAVEAQLEAAATNAGGAAGMVFAVSIGLDSTSAITAGAQGSSTQLNLLNAVMTMHCAYCGFPGVGRHFLSWNEASQALGTTTWSGQLTGAGVTTFNGLTGKIMA